MKRVYLKELQQATSGGYMVASMADLDFLMHLTGIDDPREALEHFAVMCLTFHKDPQETLKKIDIWPTGGNIMFVEEDVPTDPPEPTYKRFSMEVTVKGE